MTEYWILIISAVFINNFVLNKFLGICPFLGVSKKVNSALGMGIAVIFVMSIASVITYALYEYIIQPLEIEFMRTIVFIFVIAALVQFVEIVIKKFAPGLYDTLGVYLPLITTNCAVLGVALINIETENFNILKAFLNGAFSGVGFTLAILLLAGIREKMERAKCPKAFQGFPITLIAACIMAMAFAAFSSITF